MKENNDLDILQKQEIPYVQIHKDELIGLEKQAYERGLLEGRQESGLFAVIPMSIMENRNLSANSKLLYGEIMALAKKSGKCYATNEYLADILGLSKRSIPQLLKELSGLSLIVVDIKRSSEGTYRNILVSFFNNGGYQSMTMGGIAKERGQKRNRQTEIDNKEILAEQTPLKEFTLKEGIQKLEESPRRDLNIIALYFDKKKPDLRTREQFNAAIRRHLRPAKELSAFSDEQILRGCEKAEKQTPEWVLETTLKMLTK